MLIAPHTLALITTNRCTASCDHCCFSCSPEKGKTIPVARMRGYIEQASEISTLRVVVFTGGECFLLGSDLDDLVKAACQEKLITRFVSNGYWASSPKIATRRLERLKTRGLHEANFSTGDQHARFVRPEYVRNGAIGAAELGITTVVTFELFRESRFDFEGFVADPAFSRQVEAGKIFIKLAPWMSFNGSRRMSYTRRYLQEVENGQSPNNGCTTVLRVLAINPEEELLACCGLPVEAIEELHFGSLRRGTIAKVLARVPDDFIKIWIHLHGPDAVWRYAQRFDPELKRPVNVPHICESCKALYQNPRVREIISAHPPPNMKDIVSVYLQSLLVPPSEVDYSTALQMAKADCSSVETMKAIHRMAVAPRRN